MKTNVNDNARNIAGVYVLSRGEQTRQLYKWQTQKKNIFHMKHFFLNK